MDTLDEIKQIMKENALAMAELRISQKETAAQMAKTDAQMAKTDAKFIKLEGFLERVGQQLGDIGHSNGDVAEEFFYNALNENKYLGGVSYDEVSKNIKQKKHRIEDEYDIFMENGNAVAIVEVKHKVKKEHITKLIEKKTSNFRILFPDYSDYKLYVGIAGLAFEQQSEEYATENGIVVLKQKGNIMQVNSENMKAF